MRNIERRDRSRRRALDERTVACCAAIGALALLAIVTSPRPAFADGACCYNATSCGIVNSAQDCRDGDGLYRGPGTTCTPGSCHVGACCHRPTATVPGGSCDEVVTKAECEASCGSYVGDTSDCTVPQGGTCASYFHNAPPLACDCNQDGQVVINELTNAVMLLLCDVPGPCCVAGYRVPGGYVCTRTVNVSPCAAADTDHNGVITVSDIVKGINAANGCF